MNIENRRAKTAWAFGAGTAALFGALAACGGGSASDGDAGNGPAPGDDASRASETDPSGGDGGASDDGPALLDAARPDGDAGVDLRFGCGPAYGVDPGAPWPIAQRCPSRTSLAPERNSTVPHIAWGVAGLGGTSLVAADGSIYNLSHSYTAAGKPRWTYAPSDTSAGRATLIGADGTIYFSEDEGQDIGSIAAVGPDGLRNWIAKAPSGHAFTTPAVAPDGTLRAFSGPHLYKIDTAGQVTLMGSIARDGGPPEHTVGVPTIGPDGTIYVVAFLGDLVALRADGTLKWRYSASTSDASVGPDGTVYVGAYTASTTKNGVHALTPDGALKWVGRMDAPDIRTPPAIGPDGTVYMADDNGHGISAFASDGTPRWSFPPCHGVGSACYALHYPVVDANGIVYASGESNTVHAIKPDGTEAWTLELPVPDGGVFTLPSGVGPLSIGADGTLYGTCGVKSGEQSLYAMVR